MGVKKIARLARTLGKIETAMRPDKSGSAFAKCMRAAVPKGSLTPLRGKTGQEKHDARVANGKRLGAAAKSCARAK